MTLLALLVAAAFAADGPTLLQAVDAGLNGAGDTTARMTAHTEVPGQQAKDAAFQLWTRGPQRLVQFEAPGDMKGTRVLVESATQMYVWLPAYNKVRRVASHVNNQGFMGTMFSDADMSTTRFSELYQAAVKSEAGSAVTLTLTPKAGLTTAYARIEMDVDLGMKLPTTLRYYDASGQHLKTETRSDYVCKPAKSGKDFCQPGQLKMVDHTRKDAFTVLKQEVLAVDSGLDVDLFSQRVLQRGVE
jgi:outer membrane lipoprotein-sorting protein